MNLVQVLLLSGVLAPIVSVEELRDVITRTSPADIAARRRTLAQQCPDWALDALLRSLRGAYWC